MFLPLSVKVCFFCFSLATSSILKNRFSAGNAYAALVLPVNATDRTSQIPGTSAVNDTTVLPDPAFADEDIVWPERSSSPSFSSPKSSTTSSPISTPGAPKLSCNGKAYGKNLRLASCLEALRKMPPGNSRISFGARHHGEWDANLPFRILSSDGLCALDISHKAGAISDHSTASKMKTYAGLLINVCVETKPNEGGVVANIGENGNLAIRATPYRPNVRCASSGTKLDPPVNDCRAVIDEMPTDGKREVFGRRDDPDPEITWKLPTGYNTWRRRCLVHVDTLEPGSGKDASDWYKLCTYRTKLLISLTAVVSIRKTIAEGKVLARRLDLYSGRLTFHFCTGRGGGSCCRIHMPSSGPSRYDAWTW